MRINIYLKDEVRARARGLAEMLGLPLSRLLGFLVDYYIRKESITDEDLSGK